MLSENHDLAHELPEHKDTIHNLKMNDNHFARLFDEYDDVNKEILRAEKGVETLSDDHLHDLKKKRLVLKDEMVEIIEKSVA